MLRVLVPGVVSEQKGLGLLIACAEDARDRGLPLDFWIVGESLDERRASRAGITRTGRYRSGGDDDAILAAIPTLARGSGVFSEPAGAAAYAGLVSAADRGLVGAGDNVVVLATGGGLKDVASAMVAVTAAGTEPLRVDPNLQALKNELERRKE